MNKKLELTNKIMYYFPNSTKCSNTFTVYSESILIYECK